MGHYIELDFSLQRIGGSYHADLRASDANVELGRARGELKFDFEELLAKTGEWEEYGKSLSRILFTDPELKRAFEKASTTSQTWNVPLRFRLEIDPSAFDLHSLRWETLHDPAGKELLTTKEHFLFSRYISSPDWRLMELRARESLRALVVVTNPSDIHRYRPGGRDLPSLDVAAETNRITEALGRIPFTVLASQGTAALSNIVSNLREGIDILYLICHGTWSDGEPRLYLETPDGTADVVHGQEFVTRVCELTQRPRLIVLASCQSAAPEHCGDQAVPASLGPQLAAGGIPAVIAMQGSISVETSSRFMSTFFRELDRDGQIDRAVAAARGEIRHLDDWWMPALFMCLRKGQISWYDPGFTGGQPEFQRWHALINNIKRGRCTPIVGPGFLESLTGSFRDVARQWAETFGYPMAGDEREELPLVSQYLAVDQEESFVRDEFADALRTGVLRHYGHELPPEVRDAPLLALISAAGSIRRELEPAEPHAVLARLNLPIYISTNPDNLLADALTAAGKKPHVVLCPRDDCTDNPELPHDYTPSPEEPLIYHLFGHFSVPDSVVLTQDDYFDSLIQITRNNDLIPPAVRSSFANTALLFLGFQMNDWSFRVLFRSLMSQAGRSRRKQYVHVAVQIDPSQERIVDPDRARRYLEGYFFETQISIFWGRAEDFMRELLRHMDPSECKTPPQTVQIHT